MSSFSNRSKRKWDDNDMTNAFISQKRVTPLCSNNNYSHSNSNSNKTASMFMFSNQNQNDEHDRVMMGLGMDYNQNDNCIIENGSIFMNRNSLEDTPDGCFTRLSTTSAAGSVVSASASAIYMDLNRAFTSSNSKSNEYDHSNIDDSSNHQMSIVTVTDQKKPLLVLSDYYSIQRGREREQQPYGNINNANAKILAFELNMEVEPTQQDSCCPTCSRTFEGHNDNNNVNVNVNVNVNDKTAAVVASPVSKPKECNFCEKNYCELTCLSPCDSCSEYFCRNCSTPNFNVPHGYILCLECSNMN